MILGIIPAAGLGTRVSHLTNGGSKEMLTYKGKPLIQLAIEELTEAGVDWIIVVTRKGKTDLNKFLKTQNVSIVFQPKPDGLGSAIIAGIDSLPDIPDKVLIVLPDEVFPDTNASKKLLQSKATNVILVKYTDNLKNYGVVKFDTENRIYKVSEKPQVPDNLKGYAIVGRYLFTSTDLFLYFLYRLQDFTSLLSKFIIFGDLRAMVSKSKRVDLGNPK